MARRVPFQLLSMQIYVHTDRNFSNSIMEFLQAHCSADCFSHLGICHKYSSRSMDRAATYFLPSHFKIAVYKYRCPLICSCCSPVDGQLGNVQFLLLQYDMLEKSCCYQSLNNRTLISTSWSCHKWFLYHRHLLMKDTMGQAYGNTVATIVQSFKFQFTKIKSNFKIHFLSHITLISGAQQPPVCSGHPIRRYRTDPFHPHRKSYWEPGLDTLILHHQEHIFQWASVLTRAHV